MSLQAAIGYRKAELLCVGLACAQIETRVPQPPDHAVLHNVTALEDAQHPARNIPPVVDARPGVLKLQRTLAGHAKTRCSEILTLGLAGTCLLHGDINQRSDLSGNA